MQADTASPIKMQGHIRINEDIESEVEKILQELHGFRVVTFVEENFKIEHAKAVTAEAYISEKQTKYIVLAALEFTGVAQNSLLKLLEEPPPHIEFIIVAASKSTLLPTVRSRLPIIHTKSVHVNKEVALNFCNLDYGSIFTFLKENARISKNEAKSLLEDMFYKAVHVDGCKLSQKQIENFDKAYRLIDLNSRVQSVLALVLMGFTQRR